MNVQDEIKALKRRISELEEQEEKERVFPRFMDVYYYIQASGRVDNTYWSEEVTDFQKKGLGNVFKTKEQAEFAVEKLKVEAELRKFSRPFKEDANNFFIVFNTKVVSLNIWYREHNKSQGAIYFESAEKAQQAIEAVGEDRIKKYIFGEED